MTDEELARLARAEENDWARCSCVLTGPDTFGVRDLIEDDACPIHGAAREEHDR